MSDAYLGEIRSFAFERIPSNWLRAEGQLLNVREYQALWSLLGTTFGGDGRTTVGLPDLRGRVPIHLGQSSQGPLHPMAEAGGVETAPLSVVQIPAHGHAFNVCTATGKLGNPRDAHIGEVGKDDLSPANDRYLYGAAPANPASLVTMDPRSLTPTGGSQKHENMQPFAVVTYCICVRGNYPSRP